MYFNNVEMKAELQKIIKKFQTKNKRRTNSLYFGNNAMEKNDNKPREKINHK